MTDIQNFDVEFINNAPLFFPGQMVNGRVLIHINKDIKMNAVRMLIHGKAHISWHQPKRSTHMDLDGSSHYTYFAHTYTDTDLYMDTEVTVWGMQRTDKGEPPVLQAGSYTFPFSFLLPLTCQSSFESKRGYIRYYCKAFIDRPWKTDHIVKRAFSVAAIADLNLVSNVQLSKTLRNEKLVRGFLGIKKLGNYDWEITMSRTGVVPGEIIPFKIRLNNNTSTVIETVIVKIMQIVMYIAENQHTKTRCKEMFCATKKNIQPNARFEWINDSERIPPLAPSLQLCRIMRISYELHIEVNPAGIHTTDCLKLPIFIGNIPLSSLMDQLNERFRKAPQIQQAATASANVGQPSRIPLPVPPEVYPNLPLPTYKECTGKASKVDDKDDKGGKEMAMNVPRYLYYDWS